MKKLLAVAGLVALFACNNNPEQATKNSDVAINDSGIARIQIPNMNCYMKLSGKDTIKLRVEKFPNVITGTLQYNFYEKDKNTGDIEGQLRGDTLVADYVFMSEGLLSTRQVAFLLKDTIAIEGHGPMEEKDGKMIFKDIATIDFNNGTTLTKVSCVEDN